jgi:hypothetical protein
VIDHVAIFVEEASKHAFGMIVDGIQSARFGH